MSLSNARKRMLWGVVENLVLELNKAKSFGQADIIASWKSPNHIATARESYIWRGALEAIKEGNLRDIPAKLGIEKETSDQMSDRPLMLKIAGEVAYSLLHSYNMRHRVSFAQVLENEPS